MTILVPSPSGEYVPHDGKAEVMAKAATGPGVGFVLGGNPMLTSVNQTPQAIMRRAQVAYHANQWVGLAESTVTRKVIGLPWHLEDGNDEEYREDVSDGEGVPMTPEVKAARQLIERPQMLMAGSRPGTSTRRLMWGLTVRHLGLCGMAYWFGDRFDIRGIPQAWLYINPARMWPAEDDQGNLTGWVLDPKDRNGNGGTPLDLEEVLPFYLDPPDWGNLGTGIYERVIVKANLTTLADQHASYVLGTGGRIAGIVSPKQGTIPDEQFKALVNEFRNVNEAPDAAKRTTILQGPTDFTPTAADLAALGLIDLAKMTRDDILANWGVPPTQAGIAPQHAGGLNSGATKGYDEAIFMQGAVHDRVVALHETIQYGWLDKYQPTVIELEFEEPVFDDDSPAYALLAQSISAPLTNAERREIIGKPPTGDPLIDNAILLPSTSVLWATAPGDHVAPAEVGIEADLNPPPAPVIMGAPADQSTTPAVPPVGSAGKASAQREFLGLRKSVDQRIVPAVRKSVQGALDAQRATIAAAVRAKGEHLSKKPTDVRVWWNEAREDERLSLAIKPHLAGIAETVTKRAKDVLDRPAKADAFEGRVEAFVAKRATERIRKMNQTTREQIQDAIVQGFEQGLSAAEVAALIEGSTTFDEMRAERIARTETMFAYNDAALNSYTEFGVEMVEPLDGDQDEECIARLERGPVSIDEALDDTDHPNGTLDWAPYFGKSSTPVPVTARPAPAEPPSQPGPPPLDISALIREMAVAMKAEPMAVHVVNGEVRMMRTVIDRDVDTGRVIGSHEEYVTQ